MKALILCGGKGTRLLPLTRNIPKQLLPIANKPILFYLLEQIKEAGIADIGIVVCPDTGGKIKEAVADGSRWGIDITCINQPEPLGLAHAVTMARDFLGEDDFLMLLGDNLIECNIKELINRFHTDKADALISLKEVADPRQFGVAEVDDKGNVIRLTEKPRQPKSRLAIAGVYIFTPEIHRVIAGISPSWRGELEITDAIQKLVETGGKVTGYNLQGWWFDIGTREGLLRANGAFLDTCIKADIKGTLDEKSRVSGNVAIGQGAEVIDSIINGPVSIDENCRIKNSVIGPYASIGDGVMIEGSAVEHSIIMAGCHIYNTRPLCNSVIGSDTEIAAKGKTSGNVELFTGGCERIEL